METLELEAGDVTVYPREERWVSFLIRGNPLQMKSEEKRWSYLPCQITVGTDTFTGKAYEALAVNYVTAGGWITGLRLYFVPVEPYTEYSVSTRNRIG